MYTYEYALYPRKDNRLYNGLDPTICCDNLELTSNWELLVFRVVKVYSQSALLKLHIRINFF